MADASDTVRIADKTTVTNQLAIDSNGAASVKGASNSGVDIGDVDVLSIAAGTNVIGSVGIDNTAIDDYEAVPASTTGTLGATGGTSDFLANLLIVPGSTTGSIGTVSVRDGSTGTPMNVFVTSILPNTLPIPVPLGAKSTIGAWYVLTGANVSVIAFGKFT